jgi:hypothetical protein
LPNFKFISSLHQIALPHFTQTIHWTCQFDLL